MTISNAKTHSPARVSKKKIRLSKSRPAKPLMKAKFTELVALNFQIDPEILKPRLPKGLELNFYRDETYVSLVAMMLRNVKFYGFPIPVAHAIGEFNLRFYVRRKVSDTETRHGSCFIKDYVSSRTGAWGLSKVFQAEFCRIKMNCAQQGFSNDDDAAPKVDYRWEVSKDHWNRIRVSARERVKRTGPETKVGFVLNHSNIYSRRNRETLEYPVVRPRWQIWNAGHANFTCDVKKLFGPEFVKPLARRPASVFVANGSDVIIYRPNVIVQ